MRIRLCVFVYEITETKTTINKPKRLREPDVFFPTQSLNPMKNMKKKKLYFILSYFVDKVVIIHMLMQMLIMTSFYISSLNKTQSLTFTQKRRFISSSQHETTVRPSDLTDGCGMPKLNPSPGDHQWSMYVVSS